MKSANSGLIGAEGSGAIGGIVWGTLAVPADAVGLAAGAGAPEDDGTGGWVGGATGYAPPGGR
ncbi:MAG: hypothetical protein OK436_06900 [Thaumarchaeota archaeon]|nr:hypothetical protein [Nitrososphaerota archaeon]